MLACMRAASTRIKIRVEAARRQAHARDIVPSFASKDEQLQWRNCFGLRSAKADSTSRVKK
jgi:hypothetical protein